VAHLTHTLQRIAVFLDRDGTLGPDTGYVTDIDQFQLFPSTADAIIRLNRLGVKVIMVTNQSAIARGISSLQLVEQVNQRVADDLLAAGARLDATYYCPHHRTGSVPEYTAECDCRKPRTGMALQAQRELNLDLPSSFVVGDKAADIQLAHNFGGRGILVTTGLPEYRPLEKLQEKGWPAPFAVEQSLPDAVERIHNALTTP
jgi:D-glycero-D-manno-heptose 1,7-bisphosphate phosphatase